MHSQEQTIFALSSGWSPSAIAIVRVSGSQAGPALTVMGGKIPTPRMAKRALLRDRAPKPIDDAVVLSSRRRTARPAKTSPSFKSTAAAPCLPRCSRRSSAIEHAAAEPGEFTRRAFENGKLDLTEAEGLDDLIHADTEAQRRQALRQFKGLLGERARGWRKQIIEASALIEAGIDFSDEGDVPEELIEPALEKIARCRGDRRNPCDIGTRRTPARRTGGRDRRSAECRQVDAAQSSRAARSGDRVAARRNDA